VNGNPSARLRVAVISSSLEPGFNDLWAAAREHVADLIVVGAAPRTPQSHAPFEVPLRELNTRRGMVWRHLIGLRRLMRTFRPDLVHLNGELWSVTAQESLWWKMPVVVHGAENLWEHGYSAERWARRRLVERGVDRIAGYGSWNLAGAQHIAEVAKRRSRSVPTLVMPSIVPPSQFRSAAWSPTPLEPGVVLEILLVGRLVAMKGFASAIDAAARIKGRPVRVTLAGEGPELASLTDRAAKGGVDLRAPGQMSAEGLAAVMCKSHVQVQPSLTASDVVEQFGRSVAEAMAVGLPCVVSDSGELPRVVGENPSVIFPEGDVDALASVLQRASDTPQWLAELSERQSELAERYEPSRAASVVTQFWAEVLA
jgi:glycosyltransferase involved in cell wall biosynthesis